MAKDIYKTFKRSVSGIVGGNNINGEGSSSPSTSAPQVKYRGGTGRTWIHPPGFLNFYFEKIEKNCLNNLFHLFIENMLFIKNMP